MTISSALIVVAHNPIFFNRKIQKVVSLILISRFSVVLLQNSLDSQTNR